MSAATQALKPLKGFLVAHLEYRAHQRAKERLAEIKAMAPLLAMLERALSLSALQSLELNAERFSLGRVHLQNESHRALWVGELMGRQHAEWDVWLASGFERVDRGNASEYFALLRHSAQPKLLLLVACPEAVRKPTLEQARFALQHAQRLAARAGQAQLTTTEAPHATAA